MEAQILNQLEGHWQLMMIAIIEKLSPGAPVEITLDDLQMLQLKYAPGKAVLMTHGHERSIEFKVVSEEEGRQLQRLHEAKVGGES